MDAMKAHSKIDRFGELDYYKDAHILNNQKGKFDLILAVTSCGNSDEIIKKRNANISKLFPIIDDIIYLDFLEQKDKVLAEIVDKTPEAEIYMIDDNIKDVQTAIDLGIKAYAYRTAFHDPEELPVVDSLAEFFENIYDK